MDDYANFAFEYQSISDYSQLSLATIANLNAYFISIHKQGELFTSTTQNAVDLFLESKSTFDTQNTLSLNIIEFYRSFHEFTSNLKSVLGKLDKDIIDPFDLFHKNLAIVYNENLEEFISIANSASEVKKNVDKVQYKYFEACRAVQEQEKHMSHTSSSITDENFHKAHDHLLKLRSISENLSQLYHYEISKSNKIFSEIDKKYQIVIDRFRMNEESKNYFIKCNLEKFSKLWSEFAVGSFDFLNGLNASIAGIEMEEDIKHFDDRFRYSLYGVRIPREEFVAYDFQSTRSAKENVSVVLSTMTQQFATRLQLGKLINSEHKDYAESEQKSLVDEFFMEIQSENEIDVDLMGKMMDVLYASSSFSKTLVDFILKNKKNSFIHLRNLNNLHHLAHIFHTISLNADGIDSGNYDLNFAIIYISERTYFTNPSNGHTIFLCALLSKNTLYSAKAYWLDLIELKLARKLDEHILGIEKIDIDIDTDTDTDNINISTEDNINPVPEEKSILSSIGSTLKNIFQKGKQNIHHNNNSCIRGTRMENMIKKYKKLNEQKKKILDKIATVEIGLIIKEFVPHFANFNYDTSRAVDLIVELSEKYNISKEKVEYYVTYLNSCQYSIRRVRKKRKEEDSSAIGKVLAINHCVKFLQGTDCINLLMLDKMSSRRLKRKIYKTVLLKESVNMKVRLAIWKKLLKINDLMAKINYKEINLAIPEKTFYQIELDIQRTFCESNINESRNVLSSVLKAISAVNTNINYCQGMNYIASFIYSLSGDEEETFYLMLGLLQNTDLNFVFREDLQKLKTFFYVFERLIALYSPEIFSKLKSNLVAVNYFSSSWFITLFTNACPYVSNTNTNTNTNTNCEYQYPLILLKIWDDFLLSGWKCLVRTALVMIKSFESEMKEMRYEDMLHFLVNGIIKSSFFQNGNYRNYLSLLKEIHADKKLMSSLEKEEMEDKKITNNEDKQKIHILTVK